MKYYLSSYHVGDHGNQLAKLAEGGTIAYIPNALDHVPLDQLKENRARNLSDLSDLGIAVELFDLKDFFSDQRSLKEQLSRFSGVWVTGGNTFVLRQAMKLSGFDKLMSAGLPDSFLYSGYSAGVCVLAPDLKALQIVDRPNEFPYPQQKEVIWDGLNILDYIILPHYKSEHPESADIDQEVEYCQKNNIPYKTLRDGEAFFGNDINCLKRSININP